MNKTVLTLFALLMIAPLAAAAVPDAPGTPTASFTGSTVADVAWSAPANDGGCAVTSYTVEYTDGTTTENLTTADLDATLSGLSPATSYNVTVAATNCNGTSAASSPLSVTTAANTSYTLTSAAGQSPDEHAVHVDDANTTSVVSTRAFTVNREALVHAEPITVPENYSVALEFSRDGTNYTAVAANEDYVVQDNGTLRATVSFPANRSEGTVDVALELRINAEHDAGLNQSNPVQDHVVRVYFHSDADSDADHLADAWEMEHFGDLSRDGSGDADGDGYTDAQEYEAGTDPNNDASHPQETVVNGGGNLDDRDVGALVTGAIVFAVILAVGIILLPTRKEKVFAGVVVPVALALLIAFAVLAFFDYVVLDHSGFAFWAYLGAGWQAWTAFGVGAAMILVLASAWFLKLNEKTERAFLVPLGAALAALAVGIWVVFFLLGVPVPFDAPFQ